MQGVVGSVAVAFCWVGASMRAREWWLRVLGGGLGGAVMGVWGEYRVNVREGGVGVVVMAVRE